MSQISTMQPSGPDAESGEDARKRTHGHVIDCDGTRAIISAEVDPALPTKENYWAVGMLISILEGRNRIIGQCYKVESAQDSWVDGGANRVRVLVELVGEIAQREDGSSSFSTGIADYPKMGAPAHRIRSGDLEAMYKTGADNTIEVGRLTQDQRIPARIDLDKLLTRHFAVVGSTGVGKSTSVSLILRKIIAERKDIRVLILDPHSEFTSAFSKEAVVKDVSNLQLPFWLFKFDEFTEVIFRGQKGVEQESELLRDMIAEAKERYTGHESPQIARKTSARSGYTADSPVPYRLIDLMKLIDERLGMLEGKQEKPLLKALKDRISSIGRDPRFEFMFGNANAGGDRMQQIISDVFRVPHNGRPICVVEMSGLPSEVVSSVVSVLCRMAFDLALASQGGVQTLVVCEEAHRYIPANTDAAFWPTRQAIARIAKEGRKYGVYLGIITQRPSELDATIFSQCNTVFAMRLSNTADQKIIGGALTNGAQSTIGFLASIANREAIAFGEGMKTPMRLTFETIAKDLLPGSHIYEMQEAVRNGKEVDVSQIIRRMRSTEPAQRNEEDGGISDLGDVIALPNVEKAGMQRQTAYDSQAQPGGLRRPQPAIGSSASPAPSGGYAAPSGGYAPRDYPAPRTGGFSAPIAELEQRPAGGNSLINAFRTRS
jgi:DNA helicase HerA-like ATPase